MSIHLSVTPTPEDNCYTYEVQTDFSIKLVQEVNDVLFIDKQYWFEQSNLGSESIRMQM